MPYNVIEGISTYVVYLHMLILFCGQALDNLMKVSSMQPRTFGNPAIFNFIKFFIFRILFFVYK